jgi:hypothetical protein
LNGVENVQRDVRGADNDDMLWEAQVLGRGVRFGSDQRSRSNGNKHVKRPTSGSVDTRIAIPENIAISIQTL